MTQDSIPVGSPRFLIAAAPDMEIKILIFSQFFIMHHFRSSGGNFFSYENNKKFNNFPLKQHPSNSCTNITRVFLVFLTNSLYFFHTLLDHDRMLHVVNSSLKCVIVFLNHIILYNQVKLHSVLSNYAWPHNRQFQLQLQQLSITGMVQHLLQKKKLTKVLTMSSIILPYISHYIQRKLGAKFT